MKPADFISRLEASGLGAEECDRDTAQAIIESRRERVLTQYKFGLPPRKFQQLSLAATGLTDQQIADAMAVRRQAVSHGWAYIFDCLYIHKLVDKRDVAIAMYNEGHIGRWTL